MSTRAKFQNAMTVRETVECTLSKERRTFTVAEIAQLLDASPSTVHRIIASGQLKVTDPTAKKSLRRVARPELVRFLVSRSKPSTQNPSKP